MENIREAGDTTISSPGRSSKQPLPGMRLHDPLCSASLPQIHRISPGGWSNLSPVGDIFVPFPLKTGANMLHPLPPIVELAIYPLDACRRTERNTKRILSQIFSQLWRCRRPSLHQQVFHPALARCQPPTFLQFLLPGPAVM